MQQGTERTSNCLPSSISCRIALFCCACECERERECEGSGGSGNEQNEGSEETAHLQQAPCLYDPFQPVQTRRVVAARRLELLGSDGSMCKMLRKITGGSWCARTLALREREFLLSSQSACMMTSFRYMCKRLKR